MRFFIWQLFCLLFRYRDRRQTEAGLGNPHEPAKGSLMCLVATKPSNPVHRTSKRVAFMRCNLQTYTPQSFKEFEEAHVTLAAGPLKS